MFKNHSLGFLFFLVAILSNSLFGQKKDPQIITSSEPRFSHQYSYLHENKYHFIDTLFDNLKEYHKWNNANSDLFEFSPIGSMGTALNPLSLNQSSNLWTYYNFKAYDSYFLKQNQIKYYNVKSPLTQANYWMGYDVGQKFQIYHSQNITKDWNFLIDYARLNDLGFYTNNLSKQVSFLATSSYKSPNSRYKAYFNFINQNLHVEENGGIAADSVFEQNLQSIRSLLLVNLQLDNRSMRNRELFFNHEFKFNRSVKDSLDSTKSSNSLWIGHDFTFSRRSDTYRGLVNSGYYTNYFNGTDSYLDSSFYTSYTNSLYLKTILESLNDFELKLGAKNLIYSYGTDSYLTNGTALGIFGQLYGRIGRFQIRSNLDYILSGSLRESLDFSSSGSLRVFKSAKATLSYKLNSRNPDFYYQANYSDNFIWNNDLRKINSNELRLDLFWNKENGLRISNTTIGNFTYYDEQINPKQHGALLNLVKLELYQNFKFWDFLHFDNRLLYQVVDKAGEDVLPLPKILTRNSVYFEFSLFKKALKCLVGGELKYFSKYNSPSYIPAIGDFAVKNEGEIGNYPFVDVFANFKISSAVVFFKFEHVNQGLNSYSYYASHHYPFPDRIFRVGISWRFFN